MVAKIFSASVVGLDSLPVEVEVDLNPFGSFGTIIVGLPDAAVQEAKERIRAAVKNSRLEFPRGKVTVNLAPADLKKQGPAFDLPMAVGMLVTNGEIPLSAAEELAESFFLGELALEGGLRPIPGVLPVALLAAKEGKKRIFLPAENAAEATLVAGLEVFPVKNLRQLVQHFSGKKRIEPLPPIDPEELAEKAARAATALDFSSVKGQEHAKRALEIAAAGSHNILLNGPPGSGKTLLARTFPSILPRMSLDEMLESTKVHSVAGTLPAGQPLVAARPFRAPHHTASSVALVGGGKFPKPGEISLAHRGVLFLDEFAEFPAQVLEVLRQPLEDGVVTVSRASGSCSFPAKFILVAAMNPCPCGYATDPERDCSCSPQQVLKYQKKISGPLLDRIDLHVEVPRLNFEKMTDERHGESSEEIFARVEKARARQARRFDARRLASGNSQLAKSQKPKATRQQLFSNSEMGPKEIEKFCAVASEGKELLRRAASTMQLSGRALHRVLKVARTIADLADEDEIGTTAVAEALQYRARVGGG